MDNKNDDDEIDHSFAYYKCSEKVGQNNPRFLEAPVVRMLRIRSASLKIELKIVGLVTFLNW